MVIRKESAELQGCRKKPRLLGRSRTTQEAIPSCRAGGPWSLLSTSPAPPPATAGPHLVAPLPFSGFPSPSTPSSAHRQVVDLRWISSPLTSDHDGSRASPSSSTLTLSGSATSLSVPLSSLWLRYGCLAIGSGLGFHVHGEASPALARCALVLVGGVVICRPQVPHRRIWPAAPSCRGGQRR